MRAHLSDCLKLNVGRPSPLWMPPFPSKSVKNGVIELSTNKQAAYMHFFLFVIIDCGCSILSCFKFLLPLTFPCKGL